MLTRGDLPNGRWLSPKIKIFWYLETIPALLAIPVILYLIAYFLSPNISEPIYKDYQVVTLSMIIASVFLTYWIIELRYRRFVYALSDKDLTIKKGVMEKIRYVVPYEKIQDVEVSRTFAEVLFGIGTVKIETAGHKTADGDISLPGIENYNEVVNELLIEAKKAKEGEEGHINSHKTMIELLKSIDQKLGKIQEKHGKAVESEEQIKPLKKRDKIKKLEDSPLLGD